MTATMGDAIVNPVGPLGIEAWARLTGTTIDPWEGRALLEMDRARVAGPLEAMESEAAPSQAINVAIFDAILG